MQNYKSREVSRSNLTADENDDDNTELVQLNHSGKDLQDRVISVESEGEEVTRLTDTCDSDKAMETATLLTAPGDHNNNMEEQTEL